VSATAQPLFDGHPNEWTADQSLFSWSHKTFQNYFEVLKADRPGDAVLDDYHRFCGWLETYKPSWANQTPPAQQDNWVWSGDGKSRTKISTTSKEWKKP